ncbi:MAG: hypothetical protein NZ699_18535 [Roseiflexus sp.]|nr:hypothetical protein [Roseiflexus sp.]MCS7291120.1 hypothetical protein [Roseiflexus sp.]MDW8145866.1 hypothetical protein [Roseiflexaceae bacterium]MDW8232063.1 hypothetical protein [Roseiflexaceae bacterium]
MKSWLLVSILLLTLLQPAQPAPVATQPLRWVHAPYFANRIDWGTAAIFWFGRVDVANGVAPIPGRNYADVRVAYMSPELQVFMSVIDYYLWHEYDPDTNSSPTSYDYDGAALYLDIDGDRTGAPGTDDYVFLAKWGASGEEYSRPYQRQAHGNGSAWNTAWIRILATSSGRTMVVQSWTKQQRLRSGFRLGCYLPHSLADAWFERTATWANDGNGFATLRP